jgi:hypothetical protein
MLNEGDQAFAWRQNRAATAWLRPGDNNASAGKQVVKGIRPVISHFPFHLAGDFSRSQTGCASCEQRFEHDSATDLLK